MVAVAGCPADPMTFYFGACAGGVWKTTDGGWTWLCMTDGHFTTAAVGAIAVAPSDPNVIYAGTGEACIRNDVSHGDGVYRSGDGGKTWTNIGLGDSRHIGRIVVHPRRSESGLRRRTRPCLGHEQAARHLPLEGRRPQLAAHPVQERTRRLARHRVRPAESQVLYAPIWQAQRYPHALDQRR